MGRVRSLIPELVLLAALTMSIAMAISTTVPTQATGSGSGLSDGSGDGSTGGSSSGRSDGSSGGSSGGSADGSSGSDDGRAPDDEVPVPSQPATSESVDRLRSAFLDDPASFAATAGWSDIDVSDSSGLGSDGQGTRAGFEVTRTVTGFFFVECLVAALVDRPISAELLDAIYPTDTPIDTLVTACAGLRFHPDDIDRLRVDVELADQTSIDARLDGVFAVPLPGVDGTIDIDLVGDGADIPQGLATVAVLCIVVVAAAAIGVGVRLRRMRRRPGAHG